jgi:HSP20 family protein
VSGERTEESDKQDARYHRREIRRGSFTRRVTLPQDLDTNSVTATVSNGILKVELSPLTPIAPKKVEVKPT